MKSAGNAALHCNAIVVYPVIKQGAPSPDIRKYKMDEAVSLVRTLGPNCVTSEIIMLDEVNMETHIGSGTTERLQLVVKEHEIAIAVFNCSLTPIRQRNLEKRLGCKVIDRTGLILEIFAARAVTGEGALQVELASLEYQKTRLVRSWTHLERQRGGRGFLAGPGERQIESDRRAIRERIGVVKRKLQKTVQMRRMHRSARKDVPFAVVALCGYTNAGKTTLFNRLTGATALAENKLFATLDPSLRPVKLPSGRTILLCDTVGFISDLPTELVASFRATLEEVTEADIILHTRDAASPFSEEQKEDVLQVLSSLFKKEDARPNVTEALNKIDLIQDRFASPDTEDMATRPAALPYAPKSNAKAYVSAKTGEGIQELLRILDEELAEHEDTYEIVLPHGPAQGSAYAYLCAQGAGVTADNDEHGNMTLTLTLGSLAYGRAKKSLEDKNACATFRMVHSAVKTRAAM